MDSHFKSDSVLHNKITPSTRENCTVDNWADSKPLIKAFTLNNAKRMNVLPWFDFRSCVSSQWYPADGNYRNWKTQKNTLFAATQSILGLPLPSMIAHSRREPRRIVTQMITVAQALCLATGGPQPSVQSASYNLKHNNYSAVPPAYLIIKASENVSRACSFQKKNPKPCLRGSELYN